MYEAVTVRFPTDSSPPGPTVLEGAAASLSVIVTLFSEVGPVERTPDPSRENPPVILSWTRCRDLAGVSFQRVRPASIPSRVAEGFPFRVRVLPEITKLP